MENTKLLLDQADGLVREADAKLAASGELFNLFSDSMAVGCTILTGVFFLYKIGCVRAAAK